MYGEDVAAALRFLFNAMASKDEAGLVLQGIPGVLYLDNGPVAKSGTFRRVMAQLGVPVQPHMPRGSDGRRVTARAKGKVERPFRTVKEAHETLYHVHTPRDEAEANLWLRRYLARYNAQPHRSEPRSRAEDWRAEDWAASLPPEGVRAMCAWDRFRAFAREPERQRVGVDARVQVDGVAYEVKPSLAGETVTLWWGLFDQELFVEHGDQRFGPFGPIDGPSRLRAMPAAPLPQLLQVGGRRAGGPHRGAGRQARPAARRPRRPGSGWPSSRPRTAPTSTRCSGTHSTGAR